MVGTAEHHAKCKKPDWESQELNVFSYMQYSDKLTSFPSVKYSYKLLGVLDIS